MRGGAVLAGMSGVSRRAFQTTVALGLCWLVQSRAEGQRRYAPASLKAAMIQKIAAFVRWPDAPGKDATSAHFVLAVLGDVELSSRLRFLYESQQIGGRTVRVIDVTSVASLPACEAVFIGARFADALESLLRSLSKKPVLTLGATPGFAERGVAVNLFVDGASRRLRFEVNRASMESTGLRASYQLLSFARLVGDKPGGVP